MTPLWRTIWQFMVELKIFIPREPAVYFLEKTLISVCKNMKKYVHCSLGYNKGKQETSNRDVNN